MRVVAALVAVGCAAPKPSCPPKGSTNVPIVGAVFHDGNGVRALGSDPVSTWLAQCRSRPNAPHGTTGSLESLVGIRIAWDCPPEDPPIDFTRQQLEYVMLGPSDSIKFIVQTRDGLVISTSQHAWCQGTAPPEKQPWLLVLPRTNQPLRSCASEPAATCSGGPRP